MASMQIQKNPDASWKLLEAFYTDEDVAKLLVDGIEGTNYVRQWRWNNLLSRRS